MLALSFERIVKDLEKSYFINLRIFYVTESCSFWSRLSYEKGKFWRCCSLKLEIILYSFHHYHFILRDFRRLGQILLKQFGEILLCSTIILAKRLTMKVVLLWNLDFLYLVIYLTAKLLKKFHQNGRQALYLKSNSHLILVERSFYSS